MPNILNTKTVNHRDGTQTTWVRWRVTMNDLARMYAIHLGWIPEGTLDCPSHIVSNVHKERHGTRIYTHVCLRNTQNNAISQATKSELSKKLNLQISTINRTEVVFWENTDHPTAWTPAAAQGPATLGEWFATAFKSLGKGRIAWANKNDVDRIAELALNEDELDLASACEAHDETRMCSAVYEWACRTQDEVSATVIDSGTCATVWFDWAPDQTNRNPNMKRMSDFQTSTLTNPFQTVK